MGYIQSCSAPSISRSFPSPSIPGFLARSLFTCWFYKTEVIFLDSGIEKLQICGTVLYNVASLQHICSLWASSLFLLKFSSPKT